MNDVSKTISLSKGYDKVKMVIILIHRQHTSQVNPSVDKNEHLEEIAENLIVEHVIYTISIETNNRTPGIFSHCINSQTRLTIRDTRVCYESNTTIRESNSTNTFAQPLLTIASLSSQIQIQDGSDRTRTR